MVSEKILKYVKKDFLKKNMIFFVLLISVVFISESDLFKKSKTNLKTAPTADTYIPFGYVLIPINVLNSDSLDTILANQGTVDLYHKQGSKSVLVGRKLKILRAPLKPDQFAVLVKEQEAKNILRFHGPFIVSVQNPNSKGHGQTLSNYQNHSAPPRVMEENL